MCRLHTFCSKTEPVGWGIPPHVRVLRPTSSPRSPPIHHHLDKCFKTVRRIGARPPCRPPYGALSSRPRRCSPCPTCRVLECALAVDATALRLGDDRHPRRPLSAHLSPPGSANLPQASRNFARVAMAFGERMLPPPAAFRLKWLE